jgi:WD40 repeat protein
MSIAGIVGAWLVDRFSASHEVEAARAAQALAVANVQRQQYVSTIQHAMTAVDRGDRSEAMALLERLPDLMPAAHSRLEASLLESFVNDFDKTLVGHRGHVHRVRFSPASGLLASAGEDGQVLLWDTKSYQRRATFEDGVGEVNAIEFSADGRLLAVAGDSGRLVVHDLDQNAVIYDEAVLPGSILCMTWLGKRKELVLGGISPALMAVNPLGKNRRAGEPLPFWADPEISGDRVVKEIKGMVYVPNIDALVVAPSSGGLRVIDLATLTTKRALRLSIHLPTICYSDVG